MTWKCDILGRKFDMSYCGREIGKEKRHSGREIVHKAFREKVWLRHNTFWKVSLYQKNIKHITCFSMTFGSTSSSISYFLNAVKPPVNLCDMPRLPIAQRIQSPPRATNA